MKKLLILASLIMGVSTTAMADDDYESETESSSTTYDSQMGSDTVSEDVSADESTATGASTTTTETSRTEVEEDDSGLDKGGPMIEPFIFASQSEGAVEVEGVGAINESSDFREGGIGLRLGGHVSEIIFLAADARYARTSYDNDAFYSDADATQYNYGITLGAQTPWAGIRVWGTSVLGGEFNPNAGANDLDVKFGGAGGYRVGAGLHIAAISLNLEYEDLDYGNTDIESPGTTTVTGVDASQQGYTLSIGFPVEL
jgi:opacity protein-like surface antigen